MLLVCVFFIHLCKLDFVYAVADCFLVCSYAWDVATFEEPII